MAQHGALATVALMGTSQGLLTGVSHLHCTLVADILLSTSGPLPKEFANVHKLARVLDDAVKNGILTDKDLLEVQEALKAIYSSEPSEDDDDVNDSTDKKNNNKKKKRSDGGDDDDEEYSEGGPANKKTPNKSLVRQLNQIIISGLAAMKESDPNSLFLNPVTDQIAPGKLG
jgi:hypothetical protein